MVHLRTVTADGALANCDGLSINFVVVLAEPRNIEVSLDAKLSLQFHVRIEVTLQRCVLDNSLHNAF